MIPYTYLIEHKSTGKKYYGVKFALDADPDKFWVEYFTSSKIVHELIERDGVDAFNVSIDKVFESIEEAVDYEYRYLQSIIDRSEYLNQHFGCGYGKAQLYKTEEHKRKIAESNSKPKTGRALEAALNNIQKAQKNNMGRKQSAETQERKRQSYLKYWDNLEDKSRPHLYKKVVIDGEVYESVKVVMEKYKVTRPTVINRIKSSKWNWSYA